MQQIMEETGEEDNPIFMKEEGESYKAYYDKVQELLNSYLYGDEESEESDDSEKHGPKKVVVSPTTPNIPYYKSITPPLPISTIPAKKKASRLLL